MLGGPLRIAWSSSCLAGREFGGAPVTAAVSDPRWRRLGLPGQGGTKHSIASSGDGANDGAESPCSRLRVISISRRRTFAGNQRSNNGSALPLISFIRPHRAIGCRRLDDEKIRDASGRVRLLYHTPHWDDFVLLAVTEIRQFGGSGIRVAMTLARMLENLIETLPEERGTIASGIEAAQENGGTLFPGTGRSGPG